MLINKLLMKYINKNCKKIYWVVYLQVQKGSLADRAGLHTGDVVSTLCGRSASSMSHKEAQDTIIRNQTSVDLVVQR